MKYARLAWYLSMCLILIIPVLMAHGFWGGLVFGGLAAFLAPRDWS